MELNNNLEEENTDIKYVSKNNNDSDTEDDIDDISNTTIVKKSVLSKTANIFAKIVLSNKITKTAVTNYVEKHPKKAATDMVKIYHMFNKDKKDKLSEDEINEKIKLTTDMINEMMPVFMKYMASHYPQDKQVNFEIDNMVECDGRKIHYHVVVSE
jgi:hypothetical protein